MNDDLRQRLRAIDPVPDEVSMEPVTTESSRARMERIMNTDTTPKTAHTGRRRSSAAEATRHTGGASRKQPTKWLAGAGVAAVALIALVAVNLAGGGDNGETVVASPPLELSIAGGDSLASCLPLDATILRDMSPAFAATATAIEGDLVSLEVDRWYAGGDATTVQLRAEQGMESLIAGFDFEVGQQYLITASQGTVNFCGYSGLATPEFTAFFDQAFGG